MSTEIGLRELLAIFKKGRLFILAVTLAALLLGVGYAYFIYTPVYQASTLVDLLPYWTGPGYNESTIFADKARTKTFLKQCLIRAEEENIPAGALTALSFTEVKNTSLIEVRASHQDSRLAAAASRLAGEELLMLARRQRLESLDRQIKTIETSLQRLDQEIDPGDDSSAQGEQLQQLLENRGLLLYELSLAWGQREELTENPVSASPPWLSEGKTSSPRVTTSRLAFIATALILGLLISSFLVFLRGYWYAHA
ncbi:MAG: hypothetical protein GX973_06325 [Firmicutes bacterium]|nr:hypothetical protein [Bacillota bacterium]